jgi:hypothetical protein
MASPPRTTRTNQRALREQSAERQLSRGQKAGLAIAGGALAAGGAVLASLFGGNKIPDPFNGLDPMQFPNDLITMGHWVEFTAYETKGIGTDLLQQSGFGNKINGGTIRLPMPANLSTDYNPEYTSADMGKAAAGEVLAAGDRAIYGNNDVAAGAALGGALLGAATGGAGAGVDNIIAGVKAGPFGAALGGALGAGDGAGAAALKIATGLAQNPHKVVLFTGVNFREHQFSWKLSPRNRNESNAIKIITDMFAYYAHPEFVAGALYFKYPEFFKIKFRHPEYLFEIQPSVLKDIRVNYHGQGYAAYIRNFDGSGPPAPAEVEISLTFQETEIITKQTLYKQLSVNLPQGRRVPVLGEAVPNLRSANYTGR